LLGKSLILIVDDTASGRETLESLLSLPEYELAFASNGAEALDLAERITPDLILLDVMMPGISGFEVCRRLRVHPHLSEVPVILVTALDDRDSRLEGLDAGADEFVSKPVDRAELRVRVRNIARLNRYRRMLSERTRFEWVVEQAGDGYLVLGKRGEVLYANQSARMMLDFPEGLRLPSADTFYGIVKRKFRCEPEAAWYNWFIQAADLQRQTLYLIRPESVISPVVWLEVTMLKQGDEARQEHLVHLRNATAQRTTQRDTWTFHSMVMHKLNTPLQTVLGSLELLSPDSIGDMSTNDIGTLARLAHAGAQRLSHTIADILQYLKAPVIAHIGEGVELAKLPNLINQISTELGASTSIRLRTSLEGKKLRLSQRAIETMIWELLENAQKFHPIHMPRVEVVLDDEKPGMLTLRVSDDGVTLSPEQIMRVWSPYYQAEKYFTGEKPGMGLGLSLVAALVWEVGGECKFRNRDDGPGVVVDLALPLA
jgi:CheY-like chemotaxis protein/nitrogen-specific signal transduction histidine kinase